MEENNNLTQAFFGFIILVVLFLLAARLETLYG